MTRSYRPALKFCKVSEASLNESTLKPFFSKTSFMTKLIQLTSGTIKKTVQQDRSRAPISPDKITGQSSNRINTESQISTHSLITSTMIAPASNISSSSSSVFPQVRSGEKQTVPKLTPDSVEGEVNDSIFPVRKESTAIMIPTSTCITPDKDKELNIKPILTEPMPMLKATKNKEQNIMVSETNKSNLPALKTSKLPTVFLEEMRPIFSNLVSTYSYQDGQLNPRDDPFTAENVKPMMNYYFRSFQCGMDMWQSWMDTYNKFVITWIRLSLNWSDQFRKPFDHFFNGVL
ncbi:MAG: hypothetical protein WA364_20335 [Candidatus Nitrosopolaris sp.]